MDGVVEGIKRRYNELNAAHMASPQGKMQKAAVEHMTAKAKEMTAPLKGVRVVPRPSPAEAMSAVSGGGMPRMGRGLARRK